VSGPGDIFEPTVLHEVEVAMDSLDWRTLRENFESDTEYVADLVIDGEPVPQVAVRSRGGATRSGIKPSLQVKFHEHLPNRRFQGLRRMAIKNLLDDASFLREYLSMATYRAMGIAAPRVSFARVTVNGEYHGLYNLIENVDESFLEARFGESAGYLYDYVYAGPWDFGSRGDDALGYVPVPFQPETHEDDPNPAGLLDFVRAVNSGPQDVWAQRVSVHLDFQVFATFLAVENALTAGDALVGVFGVNNFYLYQYAAGSRFVFIPWDRGATFQAPEWPVLHRTDQTVLTRGLLGEPVGMALYLAALRRVVTGDFNEAVAGQRLEAAYALVREAALTDPKKPYTNQEFELEVERVRTIVGRRQADVLQQIDALEAGGGAGRPRP
jgi:spore coat protein CotH